MENDEKGLFDFLLGYRKTVAWFALFGVSILFRIKGYIDGGMFVDLTKATFLGFIGGNISEHLGNLGQSYFKSKVPAAISKLVPSTDKQDR
jgi:hypothetical protein